MTLREWMDAKDINILEACKAFGCSQHALKKWLNKTRRPRSKMQAKIKKVTQGQVAPNDWVDGADDDQD